MAFYVRLAICAAFLSLQSGSASRFAVEMVASHAITLGALALDHPVVATDPSLRLMGGWVLSSKDPAFGGLSGLLTDGHNFTAVSDLGLLVRFSLDDAGRVSKARIDPLPRGCARNDLKSDRDSESITGDPARGHIWIGFEWNNAICRAATAGVSAEGVAKPTQMRGWERTTGPEAMVRLADGRFLVIEERPKSGAFSGPALLFPGDPITPGTRAQELVYQDPVPYFRPTDAAQLPDGRILVLHRNFKPPFRFRAKLAILDPLPAHPDKPLFGRVIASLDEKGLTDNFEGVAVSQADGHTYIWLVSDDNYLWLQRTYLLKFELLGKAESGSDR
jgi:hypothetical protein